MFNFHEPYKLVSTGFELVKYISLRAFIDHSELTDLQMEMQNLFEVHISLSTACSNIATL